mgnify:CR=1 FL=1
MTRCFVLNHGYFLKKRYLNNTISVAGYFSNGINAGPLHQPNSQS